MLRYVLFLIALLFVVWTAGTALTQIEADERGVIRRFGRILPEKPGPGLHIGWPWGIDRVERVKVSEARSIQVGFTEKQEAEDEVVPAGQMLTGDHNLLNVHATINYRIRADDVAQFALQRDQVEAFLARTTETLLAEWMAGRKIDNVLREGKTELRLFLLTALPGRLEEYELGVDIERASIELQVPNQVKDAFERLTRTQTNMDTQKNQAKEKADKMISKMDAELVALKYQAATYANVERTNATADATTFLQRLRQYRELSRNNPDYLNTLWLDEMTRLFARMKDGGRIEPLDHYLSGGELSITQFPLQPKKK